MDPWYPLLIFALTASTPLMVFTAIVAYQDAKTLPWYVMQVWWFLVAAVVAYEVGVK